MFLGCEFLNAGFLIRQPEASIQHQFGLLIQAERWYSVSCRFEAELRYSIMYSLAGFQPSDHNVNMDFKEAAVMRILIHYLFAIAVLTIYGAQV